SSFGNGYTKRANKRAGQRCDARKRRGGYRPALEQLEQRELLDVAGSRYVGQLYRELLQREVAAAELQPWTALLDHGSSRTQVARLIAGSQEFQAQLVQGLYNQYLHRAAEPVGLNGFVPLLTRGGTV